MDRGKSYITDEWVASRLEVKGYNKVFDIAATPFSPTKETNMEQLSLRPMSPKSVASEPAEGELGRGKRTKTHTSKCSLDCCKSTIDIGLPSHLHDFGSSPVRRNLDFGDVAPEVGLPIPDDDDEDWEPYQRPPPEPKQRYRCNLKYAETIEAGDRCNLTDFQIAMMINAMNK